jgi:hypothetical protein
MLQQAFLQLTDEERYKKLDTVLRRSTKNMVNAEQIQELAKGIHLARQYIIIVHPIKRESCDARIDKNVLHIFVPEKHLKSEGNEKFT